MADEIGEYALDAIIRGVELLIIVVGQQEIARQRRKLRCRKSRPRANVGQVEMQPQPSVMIEFKGCIDGQRLRAAVAMQPECPYQPPSPTLVD
jgi:hypothetical protein